MHLGCDDDGRKEEQLLRIAPCASCGYKNLSDSGYADQLECFRRCSFAETQALRLSDENNTQLQENEIQAKLRSVTTDKHTQIRYWMYPHLIGEDGMFDLRKSCYDSCQRCEQPLHSIARGINFGSNFQNIGLEPLTFVENATHVYQTLIKLVAPRDCGDLDASLYALRGHSIALSVESDQVLRWLLKIPRVNVSSWIHCLFVGTKQCYNHFRLNFHKFTIASVCPQQCRMKKIKILM